MANEYDYFVATNSDMGYNDPALSLWITAGIEFGNDSGLGGGVDGAVRLTGVAINQGATVVQAILNFYITSKGSGTGDLKYALFGIKETNTNDFSGGNPFGRASTTANTTSTQTLPAAGNGWGADVTTSVQEIVNQVGWSSGNALGFKCLNNGSPTDVYFNGGNLFAQLKVPYLTILLQSRPNFYPTPVTQNAPPENKTVHDYGIKVIKSGTNINITDENQIKFTSKRPIFKSNLLGKSYVPATTTKQITHGYGYKPPFLVFGSVAGTSTETFKYKFPNRIVYQPNKDSVYAYGYSDITNLNITNLSSYQGSGTDANMNIYYYIFIDNVPT